MQGRRFVPLAGPGGELQLDRDVRRPLAVLAIAIAVALATGDGRACSVCRCGDPAFSALGLNIQSSGSLTFALDYDRRTKSQGEGDGYESMTEDRLTAVVAYSPSEMLTLFAQLPYASRQLTTAPGGEGPQSGRGAADPELYALLRVWRAPLTGELGRRAWVGLQLGVKTSGGENDVAEDGERLDEHVQPGTGSTDWIAGIAAVRVLDRSSSLFGSAQYRSTGDNRHDYRYGSSALANLGYERRVASRADLILELNYRSAGRDRIDANGELDPDTGGEVLYVTPRVVLTVAKSVVLRLSAQVPAVRRLNGVQTEGTVWGAGLTWVSGS